jgi:hypothetical protein
MALVIDKIDYCLPEAPYSYNESCPEDWWKRSEHIEYANHSFSKDDDSQSKEEKEFLRLSKTWKEQTNGYSSVGSMVMHPAYLEIISYGEKMIPFILKDLQNKPSHWFIALKTLAKTSPVKPEDAGNIKKMTEAWIAWGYANGKLS